MRRFKVISFTDGGARYIKDIIWSDYLAVKKATTRERYEKYAARYLDSIECAREWQNESGIKVL